MEIDGNLDVVLEIINTLIQNKEISKEDNPLLYQNYVNSSEIGNLTDKIAEKMGFDIYRLDNWIYKWGIKKKNEVNKQEWRYISNVFYNINNYNMFL